MEGALKGPCSCSSLSLLLLLYSAPGPGPREEQEEGGRSRRRGEEQEERGAWRCAAAEPGQLSVTSIQRSFPGHSGPPRPAGLPITTAPSHHPRPAFTQFFVTFLAFVTFCHIFAGWLLWGRCAAAVSEE